MVHDLVIRNGLVVDGTGGEPRVADVAIADGRITSVGEVDGRARREIDAEGCAVTPGFIDAHTHMDAQVFWDPLGSSSCWHGVTSVVMGNCGFTLAPTRADGFEYVVRNLERAEDISAAALAAGVTRTWEHFSEYLDVVDALPKAINYGANCGHSALRTWAMGERAFTESATEDDLALMAGELRDAMRAGAVGFTTSRGLAHETSDGRPVASRQADWAEVVSLVGVLAETPDAIVELNPGPEARSPEPGVEQAWYDRYLDLAVRTGVAQTFGLIPGWKDWRNQLSFLDATAAAGTRFFGQAHSRGVHILLSFETQLPFDTIEEWKPIRALPLDQQRIELTDPRTRERLVRAVDAGAYGHSIGTEARPANFDLINVYDSPNPPYRSVAELAAERGVHPVEYMIDLAVERDMRQLFLQRLNAFTDDDLLTVMKHPQCLVTFSDSGAHVSQISDWCLQTHFLSYWVRDRQAFTLSQAVKKITLDIAQAWGFHDRGVIRPGAAADINVFDPDGISPQFPVLRTDLPGGARRWVQGCDGIRATMVGGEVTFDNGEHTGALPGRLIRRPGRAG